MVLRIRRQGLGAVTAQVGHPDGTTTLYAHPGTLAPAMAGSKRGVLAGEPSGHMARTGVTYGTDPLIAVTRGHEALDPEPLLGMARCR